MLQRASILAEQVKPMLATLASHLEVPVQAPAPHMAAMGQAGGRHLELHLGHTYK